MSADQDRVIDTAAKNAMEAVITANGRAAGKYALIIQGTVDSESAVASWSWYWNPEYASEGDGT